MVSDLASNISLLLSVHSSCQAELASLKEQLGAALPHNARLQAQLEQSRSTASHLENLIKKHHAQFAAEVRQRPSSRLRASQLAAQQYLGRMGAGHQLLRKVPLGWKACLGY
jgi:septal ring factor EnvC (AmiA/AmiB activator)